MVPTYWDATGLRRLNKLNLEEVVNFVGQAIDKSELKHVFDSYREVFQEELGCLKGTTVNLQVSDDAKPVF